MPVWPQARNHRARRKRPVALDGPGLPPFAAPVSGGGGTIHHMDISIRGRRGRALIYPSTENAHDFDAGPISHQYILQGAVQIADRPADPTKVPIPANAVLPSGTARRQFLLVAVDY